MWRFPCRSAVHTKHIGMCIETYPLCVSESWCGLQGSFFIVPCQRLSVGEMTKPGEYEYFVLIFLIINNNFIRLII
jgi:hypothetical protein